MKLIIHGGFFSESLTNNEVKLAKQNALKSVVLEASKFLENHSALETVVYAVSLLENDELFNAGIGSQIQSDGKIRMSASLMDGNSKKFSGVINLEEVKNPIFVAQKLMQEDDRVLSGEGALAYAREKGFEKFSTEIPQRRKEFNEKLKSKGLGTVGCVALDKNGNIAAATSTGGKGFEIPCRVSDSATTSGNFANSSAGVSCTGVGEDIVSVALASSIVNRIGDGMDPEMALDKSFADLKEFDGFAGVIGIDAKGNVFHQDSHPYMVWASYEMGEIKAFE